MPGKLINLRLGEKLLKEIDAVVKSGLFDSRTEFIKDALRKAVEERRKERLIGGLRKKLHERKRPAAREQPQAEHEEEEQGSHLGRHSIS